MVSVKPDPDDAFQHVGGSQHIDEELYRTTSRLYNDRASWLSASQSFHAESHHQMPRLTDASTGWPIARQRFPDARDAPVLEPNYAASRSPADTEKYTGQRGGTSPGQDSGHEPWSIEYDRSRRSPPPLAPPTSVNSDPYRTVAGHHQAAELSGYRSGADGNGGSGADQGGLYQPRKLLADFFRHRERRDHYRRLQQQQQEAREELGDERQMAESGRLVKSASAYDGSPPAESEATNFFNGRRQTWPFGTSAVPVVRRRQPQQNSGDQYAEYVEEDVDKVDRSAAVLQQSAAVASPMSRLIQRYDRGAVTTSSNDAFPVAVSANQTLPNARGDWFPLPWQPPITSAVENNNATTENSLAISDLGDGTKTYSCHICSYIG